MPPRNDSGFAKSAPGLSWKYTVIVPSRFTIRSGPWLITRSVVVSLENVSKAVLSFAGLSTKMPVMSGMTYRFGPFRLDTAECLLVRNGERVPLEPQVYRTLAVLVENHQHLSRKEWLLQQIWGDTHVEERGLTRNISVLRRVLGAGYIETISKRGYRFVGEVAEVSVGTESPEAYQRN